MWNSRMAEGGSNKKRLQYCTNSSRQVILYLRALQGHSGRNPIDPSLQDNVLIPNDFFEYIYHMGCAINLHSIMNSGLIRGEQNLSKRQTVFFTSVDPVNKEHKDPCDIDLEAPRLAWYKQKVEKTSRHGVLGRKKTCSTERIEVLSNKIEFLSNKIERNHPLRLTPSLLYPESCYDGIWRNHIREIIGWKNCILKLLEVVKTPNKSKQNQETNYQERWDLLVSNHLVCLLRRSEKMYCLAANAQTQERWDLWVDNQPVCSISSRKERHWLQGVWIATCSCETSRKLPCSRAREEGRESSSSRSTSSRLAAR